jgi:hypothetical protein
VATVRAGLALTLLLVPAAIMLSDAHWFAPVFLTFPAAVVVHVTQRYPDTRRLVGWLQGWVMVFQLPVYALTVNVAARRGRLKAAACAIALLHLTAIVVGGPWSWGPSLDGFSRRLRDAAGEGARDCGVVPHPEPRGRALDCARTALADGAAFSVGFQVQGIDSTIYRGLARPARGSATGIDWDGVSGVVPLSVIRETHCAQPSIQEETAAPGSNADRPDRRGRW